jgi:hypothetical protein
MKSKEVCETATARMRAKLNQTVQQRLRWAVRLLTPRVLRIQAVVMLGVA